MMYDKQCMHQVLVGPCSDLSVLLCVVAVVAVATDGAGHSYHTIAMQIIWHHKILKSPFCGLTIITQCSPLRVEVTKPCKNG